MLKKRKPYILEAIIMTFIFLSIPPALIQAQTPGTLDRVIFSTPPVGSGIHMVGMGLTQLFNKHIGIASIVQPYPGGTATLKSIHDGKGHLLCVAAINANAFAYGIQSEMQPEVKEPYPEIRLLMGGHFAWWGWVTIPDTKIKSLQEAKGHTVHYLVPGNRIQWVLCAQSLKAVGLDPEKDVKHLHFDDSPSAAKALKEKKLDVLFAALETAYLNEVRATRGLEVLPFTQEMFQKLDEDLKGSHVLKKLPAGYLSVITRDQEIIGRRMIIAGRDDLPEDLVYRMVKTTVEQRNELQSLSPVFREYGIQENVLYPNFLVPYHPGSVKYFKEAGWWTTEHEALNQDLLKKLPKKTK